MTPVAALDADDAAAANHRHLEALRRKQELGVALLGEYRQQLLSQGYTQLRVDTLVSADGQTTIRHHYVAGEWSLTVNRAGSDAALTVKYSVRANMPSVDQLLQDTIGEIDRTV